MGSTDLTRYELQLGVADSYTGWYNPDYSNDLTITGIIRDKGAAPLQTPMGAIPILSLTLFTQDPIAADDIVKDAFNDYYKVLSVEKIPWQDSLYAYRCELKKKDSSYTRPSTSGTWNVPQDPAYRQKKFIDDWVTSANLKEDDNSTNASWVAALRLPDYNLQRVFFGKQVDLVFSVADARNTALIEGNLAAYAYDSEVDVDLYAVDKTGLTGRRLVYAAERELQLILESHPTGSLRSYGKGVAEPSDLGAYRLWHKQVTIQYSRSKLE